ncbi:MAG: hypothetical protein SNJ68_06000 [Cyanobacteriota bacterium]
MKAPTKSSGNSQTQLYRDPLSPGLHDYCKARFRHRDPDVHP